MRSYRRGEQALAIYLSSITGFIDTLGFLYLGGYFLSFMSGNTTRLTSAVTQGVWGTAARAGGVMALFLVGVMIGAVISQLCARRLAPGRSREVVLLFVCATASIASLWVATGFETPAVLSLSFTVGAMNSVFERNGVVTISLTYMTGTLVRMAQQLVNAFFGGSHNEWLGYFFLWASLAAGAIFGGWCYNAVGLRSVWIVTAMLLAGTAVALAVRERRRRANLAI